MARVSDTKPEWVEEYLRSLRPLTQDELKRGHIAFKRAWKNRSNLDVRPSTTTELVRSVRDES
jgi:hypothetical protein